MDPFLLLMLLSALGVAALFVALAVMLTKIVKELESVGGENRHYGVRASTLSRIRMGVRAIEVHTRALPVAVTTLNGGLSAVRDGLDAIDRDLDGLIAAVSRQEGA